MKQSIKDETPIRSGPAPRHRSFVWALEWFILIAVIGFIAFRVLPRAWRHLNTDFPNYYVTARLLREGYSTHRVYEWIWLQRQKDRMGILPTDQPVVGFVPHTPFSALLFWPLTYWSPLAAKHIWTIFNLLLVTAIGVLLHALTRLEWRRLALLIGLSYPLLRNLDYGQYYIVILTLLTAALWLYVRGEPVSSGALVGVAAGLKIFPVFFLLYFARKRDWRAAAGLIIGALLTIGLSTWAFGLELHRTYLLQVLPWAMRGDAMDPYALSPNSISALLHKLFIFEPQWNPRPLLHAPTLYAFLSPLLQIFVLAPAIYLASPADRNGERLQLEWSTVIVALLAISTLPASYHFTLLILPTAILAAVFLHESSHGSTAILLLLYLGIGFPAWPHVVGDSWHALLGVPRLYLVLLYCGLCYFTMMRRSNPGDDLRIDRRAWAVALGLLLILQIGLTLQHQRGLYDGYRERIALRTDILSASQPAAGSDGVSFIALKPDGYVLGSKDNAGVRLSEAPADQLSHTGTGGTAWVEEARVESDVTRVTSSKSAKIEITNAEFPVASADGKWLAYLRDSNGSGSLWVRALSKAGQSDTRITTGSYDVEEMTFLPDGSVIFAAELNGHASELYQVKPGEAIQPLHVTKARYPAASPDGHWLAYGHRDRGVWNLWLEDLATGQARRLTTAECNDISPAWQADSKTLIYASDCGRALWFTALNRERVEP